MELGGVEVSEAVGTKGLSGLKNKKSLLCCCCFFFFVFFFGGGGGVRRGVRGGGGVFFSFFSLSFPLIPSHLLCCFQKDQMAAFAFPATIERTEVCLFHSAEQHLFWVLVPLFLSFFFFSSFSFFVCFVLFCFLYCCCCYCQVFYRTPAIAIPYLQHLKQKPRESDFRLWHLPCVSPRYNRRG